MEQPRPLRNPQVTPHPKPEPKIKNPKPLRAKRWGVHTSKRRRERNASLDAQLSEARSLCFTRDGWSCQRCGSGSGAGLHAHHVEPRARGGRHELENLVTLCVRCHAWVHDNPEAATREGWLQ